MPNSWLTLNLIASQLSDIHESLSKKILDAPRHKPKWIIEELTISDPDTGESKKLVTIGELEGLYILIGNLRKLAQQDYDLATHAATSQKPPQD